MLNKARIIRKFKYLKI